jgi:hypothetical protein
MLLYMTETITNPTSIEHIAFGIYTISKDYDKFTVRITRPSKAKFGLGLKIVHYVGFSSYKDISMKIMRMNLFVEKFMSEQNQKLALKEAEKLALSAARKKFTNPFYTGQILYRSWGYEQTNVNFYQIVKTKKKSIIIRELAQDRVETGWLTGTTVPLKDNFIGDELTKIIQIRIWNDRINSYVNDLSEWDGGKLHYSSYH